MQPNVAHCARRVRDRGTHLSALVFATLILTLAACSSDTAGSGDVTTATVAASPADDGTAGPALADSAGSVPASPASGVVDTLARYDIGEFHGTDIWVDPVNGDDDNDGSARDLALRTVDAAWQRVPSGDVLTTGMRLMLAPGTYPAEGNVNYWEDRHGTADAPIILEAADGPHTATFAGDMNVFGVSYLYVLGVDIIRDGDAFHCEQCNHILIRDAELSGGDDATNGNGAHETVKVNQSQHIYIEDSDIHGADDNAIDFVAVQYGHVIGNRIHDAVDWCMYAKGGSAYIDVVGNEVFDCGTGGVTAGQGTGFEFMAAPWLQYEAYGIRIVGNVIHGVEGAGLGVNGGYDVLLANNTLYRVGSRSHVIEIAHGRRGCDGDTAACQERHDAGGWGSTGEEQGFIPSKHVYVYDNLVLNPGDAPSQWQQFQIDGPLEPPAGSGAPSPSYVDDDLRIVGNVVWNGPADHPLGTGDGCPDTNPTCNDAQIRADNAINTIRPELVDPEHGDFRLTDTGRAALPPSVAIPAFSWDDLPTVPVGPTDNTAFDADR